jgi:hypothetical protein
MRWASGYQSMLVPIPNPPTTAMTSMVSHQAAGKSPVNTPVKAKAFMRHPSPISTSCSRQLRGAAHRHDPHQRHDEDGEDGHDPLEEVPMTTPQYPATSV